MKNSAILAALKAIGISLFGAAVYKEDKVLFENVTGKVEDSQFGQKQLVIEDEATKERAYIRLGRGVDPTKASFNIVQFKAERAAEGKTSTGQPWSVPAGKLTAYAM